MTLLACGPGLGAWCVFSPDSFRYLEIARRFHETGGFQPHKLLGPPGFSVILAPLLAFDDLPLLPMRLLFSICWAATAAMTYLLHRDELGNRLAFVAGLLVAMSSILLRLTASALSESVFIALIAAVLVVTAAWQRGAVKAKWTIGLGGLLAAAACLVRSTGLVLPPAVVLAILLNRGRPIRRRLLTAGAFGLVALLPTAAWELRQSHYSTGVTYAQIWKTARSAEHTDSSGLTLQMERLAKFGPLRLEAVKEAVVPRDLLWRAFNPPLGVPTTWLVGGSFVIVALIRSVRHRRPEDLFVVLSLLMLSFWPWDEGVRLVAPLIPILVGYPLWVGLLLWRKAGARRLARAGLLSALGLWVSLQAAGMFQTYCRLPAEREKARSRLKDMSDLAAWHEANTPPGGAWVGVTPKGSMDKVLLLGAAYLSRRPLTTIDVVDPAAFDLRLDGHTRAFVHDSLVGVALRRWTYVPTARVLGFKVLESMSPSQTRPFEP